MKTIKPISFAAASKTLAALGKKRNKAITSAEIAAIELIIAGLIAIINAIKAPKRATKNGRRPRPSDNNRRSVLAAAIRDTK